MTSMPIRPSPAAPLAEREKIPDLQAPSDAVSPIAPEPEPRKEEENIIGEKTNPTLNMFGHLYDVDSIIVGLLHILIWVIIWRITGMYKTLMLERESRMTLCFRLYSGFIYCIH